MLILLKIEIPIVYYLNGMKHGKLKLPNNVLWAPEQIEICKEVNESCFKEVRKFNSLKYANQLRLCALNFWNVYQNICNLFVHIQNVIEGLSSCRWISTISCSWKSCTHLEIDIQ